MSEAYARKEHDTVYLRVERFLMERPETRNSDRLLFYHFLTEAYQHLNLEEKYEKVPHPAVALQAFWEVLEAAPDKSTVKRTRARIQNTERRLLPTDPDVLKRRKLRAEDIHSWTQEPLPQGEKTNA